MAEICQLVDALGTINLLDATKYSLPEGFLDVQGKKKYAWGGDNVSRDGADLMLRKYLNISATVTIDFGNRQGPNTAHDTLQANIDAIDAFAHRAEDAQIEGHGTEAELQIQWEHSTSTRSLVILAAEFVMPSNYRSLMLGDASYIPRGELRLTCRPYAYGAESVSHENGVDNPSFERGTVGALPESWNNEDPGFLGDNTISTAQYYYGSRSVRIAAAGAAVADMGGYSDAITVPTAASTGYVQAAGFHVSGAKVSLEVYDVTHAAWCALGAATFWNEADSAWHVKGTTFTKPSGCISVRGYLHVKLADTGGFVIYCDAIDLNPVQAAAPIFWLSSHNLVNHIDADADHINYFDIYGVPGSLPAGLRIAGLDGEIAQRVRANPSKFILCLEGEAGTLGGGVGVGASAVMSGGQVARTNNGLVGAFADLVTFTLNSDMVHRMGDFRLMAAYGPAGAGAITIGLRAILKWGATPTTLTNPAMENTAESPLTIPDGIGVRHWGDLGLVKLPPVGVPRDPEIDQVQITIQYTLTPGGVNRLDLDCIYLVPQELYWQGSGVNVVDSIAEPPCGYRLVTISDDTSDKSMDVVSVEGNPLEAWPGIQNRYHWRNAAIIATTGTVRVKIRPRYRLI